jgi:hypothetical protein
LVESKSEAKKHMIRIQRYNEICKWVLESVEKHSLSDEIKTKVSSIIGIYAVYKYYDNQRLFDTLLTTALQELNSLLPSNPELSQRIYWYLYYLTNNSAQKRTILDAVSTLNDPVLAGMIFESFGIFFKLTLDKSKEWKQLVQQLGTFIDSQTEVSTWLQGVKEVKQVVEQLASTLSVINRNKHPQMILKNMTDALRKLEDIVLRTKSVLSNPDQITLKNIYNDLQLLHELYSTSATMTGVHTGVQFVNPSIIQELFHNGEFKPKEANGRHSVACSNGYYFKMNPDFPGRDFAIDVLYHLVMGIDVTY